MPRLSYKIQKLLEVLFVCSLPVIYVGLIFGAWLYGRLADSADRQNIPNTNVPLHTSMVKPNPLEVRQETNGVVRILPGKPLAKGFNCTACHREDTKLVGPAFVQVAERYAADKENVRNQLVQKIKAGGKGNWGEIPMPPHPQYSEEDIGKIVDYILSLTPD